MSDQAERSRFYGEIDTGKWEDHDLAVKAVQDFSALTPVEKFHWRRMCAKLEIPYDIGL